MFGWIKQSIWRHIQLYGLATAYRDLANPVRLSCKHLACLAFVPLNDVVESFEILQKKAPNECLTLYKYFEDYYIWKKKRGRALQALKDPHFTHVQWNVHDRTMDGMPRTSNNIEGWHNGFSGMVSKHPHLLVLIDAIKTEQSHTENNYIKLSTGRANSRKKRWVELEERIVNILKEYKKDSLEEWISNLSLLIQF